MKAIIVEGSSEEITAFILKTQGRGKRSAVQMETVRLDAADGGKPKQSEADTGVPDGKKPVSLNIKDAAQMLGVGETTMRELARQSDFPSFKVGNRVLVTYDGLQKWAREQPNLQGVRAQEARA